MKKYGLLLLMAALMFLSGATVRGQGTLTFFIEAHPLTAAPGEKLSLLVSCAADSEEHLATYRAKVSFDASCLQFKGLRGLGSSTDANYQYRQQGNVVTIVYLSESAGQAFHGADPSPLFELDFTVAPDAPPGKALISAAFDGAGNPEAQRLSISGEAQGSVLIQPPEEPDCALIALQPDVGALSPDFQPELLEYTLEVPYSVDRVTLYAQARDPQASVRVNRKTLERMGSQTPIQATVTGADGKTKQVYTVTVHRGEKPTASQTGNGSASSRKPAVVQGGTASSKGASSRISSGADGDSQIENGSSVGTEGASSQKKAVSAVYSGTISTREDRLPAFFIGFVLCAGAVALLLLLFRNAGKHFPTE